MSRIGKMPVTIPDKVSVNFAESEVHVKGPKGELRFKVNPKVKVEIDKAEVKVSPMDDSAFARSLWGTTRSLINNMVHGVGEGFVRTLEFNGVGYKAVVKGKALELSFGYSHLINYPLPEGIAAKVEKNQIHLSGCNKELLGLVASQIRAFRPPEPYKGKGVKYLEERIIRKAGKTGGK